MGEGGNIAQDFFQENEEFLAVNIGLKTELTIIVKNLRKNLVGRVLFWHHLIVRHMLNVLLSFFVEDNIRHLCLISWYNEFNWFLYPALVKQHIPGLSVSSHTPRVRGVSVLSLLLLVSKAVFLHLLFVVPI